MKIHNILLILSLTLLFGGCEIFQMDNYDGPNASFSGGIKDAVTGGLVETDLQNGSAMRAYELGWPEGAQSWVIKQSGEFLNEKVFAAHYKIEFINCNFYPFVIEDLEIKKGKNNYDFEVTPYIRVKDVNISKAGNQIVASFKLQGGKPEVKLSAIRLYAFTDMYVGEQVKFSIQNTSCYKTFSPAATIDESTVYTLSIDVSQYSSEHFKYNRNYYFRVGALASVSGVGTVRHNYAPLVVISL